MQLQHAWVYQIKINPLGCMGNIDVFLFFIPNN